MVEMHFYSSYVLGQKASKANRKKKLQKSFRKKSVKENKLVQKIAVRGKNVFYLSGPNAATKIGLF